ncbi:MAG: hypothetical protein L3J59_03390 [Methylococcaceae bacterium]|nr:hypothetical protein [Methylococcaceae bacterium]
MNDSVIWHFLVKCTLDSTFLSHLTNYIALCFTGAYGSIQRFVKQRKIDNRNSPSSKQVFIPWSFPVGEACLI